MISTRFKRVHEFYIRQGLLSTFRKTLYTLSTKRYKFFQIVQPKITNHSDSLSKKFSHLIVGTESLDQKSCQNLLRLLWINHLSAQVITMETFLNLNHLPGFVTHIFFVGANDDYYIELVTQKLQLEENQSARFYFVDLESSYKRKVPAYTILDLQLNSMELGSNGYYSDLLNDKIYNRHFFKKLNVLIVRHSQSFTTLDEKKFAKVSKFLRRLPVFTSYKLNVRTTAVIDIYDMFLNTEISIQDIVVFDELPANNIPKDVLTKLSGYGVYCLRSYLKNDNGIEFQDFNTLDFQNGLKSWLSQNPLDTEIQHSFEGFIESKSKILISKIDELGQDKARLIKTEANRENTEVFILWPSYLPASGGFRNTLVLINMLVRNNLRIKLVFHEEFRRPNELSQIIEKDYFKLNAEIVNEINLQSKYNVIIAINHRSVNYMKLNASKDTTMGYFVQDYEPFFYPMSRYYLDALTTYFDPNIEILTSLKWMAKKIESVSGREVRSLGFAVDTDTYRFDESNNFSRKGIIFYAKPDTPRRLYEFGREVLTELRHIFPDIQITTFGNSRENLDLTNVQALGVVPSTYELAQLYNSHKIGMVFSPTNPSGIPFEMMLCGLPFVDIAGLEFDYQSFGDSHFLKMPKYDLEAVLHRLVRLISDGDYWLSSQNAGFDFMVGFENQKEVEAELLDFVDYLITGL